MIDTDAIRKLRKAGKQPVINLSPATEIKRQKRPRDGRPRKFAPGTPIAAHYIGRRGGARPYCLAKGCTKDLRVHQLGVCSETCRQSVINHALWLLRQCSVTRARLIDLWGED